MRGERSGKLKERRKRNKLNQQKEKKKEKKWDLKNWEKIFVGRKKNLGGRACPIE